MAVNGELFEAPAKKGHGLCVWCLGWHQQLRRCSMCGGPFYCCTTCQLYGLVAKNVPRMVTATSCDPCRSYHAASSYSSHAPSSRAAGAVGESCDLAPPFFPFPPLLSGCVRVPPCARLSPALVAAYTLPLCLIHCTPVGSRLPPGFKTLPCPRTVGQPVCVLPDRRMQFAPLSLPLLLAPPCGRPSWLRSV